MKLKIKRFTDAIEIPEYQTKGSVGLDLVSPIDIEINAWERGIIPAGLGIQLPRGYEAQIRSRSSLAIREGIIVINSPGTIDFDYRGEIHIVLFNLSGTVYKVNRGDRVAQMIINKVAIVNIEEVEELDETERGDGGIGSTGK